MRRETERRVEREKSVPDRHGDEQWKLPGEEKSDPATARQRAAVVSRQCLVLQDREGFRGTHIPNSCGSMPSVSSFAFKAGSTRPSMSHMPSSTLIIGCLGSLAGTVPDLVCDIG